MTQVAAHIAKALDIDVLLAALASKLTEGAPDEPLVPGHLHRPDRNRDLADLPFRDERGGLTDAP